MEQLQRETFQLIESELAERQINGTEHDALKTERRQRRRCPFERVEKIAPYDGLNQPGQEEYLPHQCHDISATGFSFFLPLEPAYSSVVLKVADAGNLKYMIAVVVNVRQVVDNGGQYLVGCQFNGKLSYEEAAQPQQ